MSFINFCVSIKDYLYPKAIKTTLLSDGVMYVLKEILDLIVYLELI